MAYHTNYEGQLKTSLSGKPLSSASSCKDELIFQRKKVQQRNARKIMATGDHYNDLHLPLGNGGGSNHSNYQDNINVNVPAHIMLTDKRNLGTAPCEIMLDRLRLQTDNNHF